MRAISTVLDVSMFLLLASVAVGTIAVAPAASPPESSVDETVESLGTSTATVTYTLDGRKRTARGTAAGLLARAAVANATVDGEALAAGSRSFDRAIRARATERVPAPNETQIRARWIPFPNASVGGRFVVGADPPPDVDVAAATLTAAGPLDRPRRVEARSYRALGAEVATAVVGHYQPPDGESIENQPRRHRRDALAERFGHTLSRQFDDPSDAEAELTYDTVRITVRRWGE